MSGVVVSHPFLGEILKQHSVFFGVPTYDCQVSAENMASMVQASLILANGKHDSRIGVLAGCAFVDRARNKLVASFLESDCTDLFFVDADIGFDALAIPRFMESPHEILVGIPPKRKPEPEFHIGHATQVFRDGAFECKEAPTAFMRIRRSVFEKIDAAYPELKTAYKEGADLKENPTPYFQCGIVDGEFLGEDIFFCRLWSKLGGSIWIDANVDFVHRGSHPFKGNCLEYLVSTKQVVLKENP